MLTQVIWWTGNLLLIVLLVRSVSGRFFSKYPIFYFYLSWALLDSFLSFYLYVVYPSGYERYYWSAEFLSVALGYCIIWEIYRQVLADYPGAARMAQSLLLLMFIALLTKVLVVVLAGRGSSLAGIPAVLERNLRTVQAILLVCIVGLLLYYAIPVGRNLQGMISGYGLFVGASLANLTLGSRLGDQFQPWWQYLQPAAYLLSLLIWTGTLWMYVPNPKPKATIELEQDYRVVSAQVERAINQARSYLVRAVRP